MNDDTGQSIVSRESAAMGAVMGALVGDAAGGTLEFRQSYGEEAVDEALSMSGGGIWGLAPGQITDVGELTMSLANSIVDAGRYDQECAARHYQRWYESRPFDIGNTTANAFSVISDQDRSLSTSMIDQVRLRNMSSKANGGLMRLTPLAVWAHRLAGDDQVAECAIQDAWLSHGSQACRHANAAYAITLASLVREPGDLTEAIGRTRVWVHQFACPEVREWFDSAVSGQLCPVSPQIGFVKIAFTHAYYHLMAQTDYLVAIRQTIQDGGDTDTNACIVGGLLGALHGVEAIPESMRQAVLKCDTKVGQPRPEWLHPREVRNLVPQLIS